MSALYHRGTWSEAGRRRLQRLDHAMIFFLIAGTATPAFLLDAPGAFGLGGLIVMWALTLAAAAIHLAWMNAPELLVGGTFVGLGWAAGLSLIWVWIHAGVAAGVLMLAGGLLYTAGALSYHRRWLNPYPSVFGYHEVFHTYVAVAAACQYVAIARFMCLKVRQGPELTRGRTGETPAITKSASSVTRLADGRPGRIRNQAGT